MRKTKWCIRATSLSWQFLQTQSTQKVRNLREIQMVHFPSVHQNAWKDSVYSHSPCTLRDQSEVNYEAGPEASQIVLSVEQKTLINFGYHHCPIDVQSKQQDIREFVSDLRRMGGSSMNAWYCANNIFFCFLDLLLYCNYFWSLCNIRIVRKILHYQSEVEAEQKPLWFLVCNLHQTYI